MYTKRQNLLLNVLVHTAVRMLVLEIHLCVTVKCVIFKVNMIVVICHAFMGYQDSSDLC